MGTALGHALGAFPLGGTDAPSLSVADPLAGLLSDPLAQREFLLRSTPNAPAGVQLLIGSVMGWIDYGNVLNKGASDSFCVEIMAQLPSVGNDLIAGKQNLLVTDAGWSIRYESATNLVAYISDGAGHNVSASASYAADNLVHWIALNVDRDAQLASLYIDGEQRASVSISTVGSLSNAATLRLGALTNLLVSSPAHLTRFIMWPIARTKQQIKDNVRVNMSAADAAAASVYSKIDEGSGTSIGDSSGHGIVGTLTGGEWVPSIGEVAIDISGSGYTSLSTDTPFKHFHPGIQKPGDFSVSLPVPALFGSMQSGVGAVVVANPDGLHDTPACLDWLGKQTEVLLGPRYGALTDFTPILRGPASAIGNRMLDAFTVLFRDAKFNLQRPLQVNKYGGFGAALRLNGSSDWVATTLTSPVGSLSIGGWVRPKAGGAALSFVIGSWRNGTTNLRRLRLISDGTGNNYAPLFDVRNDAGTLFAVDPRPTYAIPAGTRAHVMGVLDTVALTIRLFLNGVEISPSPVSVTGTFNNTITNFAMGRESDAALNFYIGDIDEISTFSRALTPRENRETYKAPLQGTETGLIGLWHYDEGSGATAVDSAPSPHNGTITGSTWVGSLEGDASIAGTPKPLATGKRRQVQPILVDPQNNVMQFHDGSMQAVDALRDRGDPITFAANVTDIYASTPAAGTYNTCLTMGLVRMGSKPVGIITGDIQGDNGGEGYSATVTGIARKLLLQYCGWDSSDIDIAAFATLLAQEGSSTVGFYWDKEIKRDEALLEVFNSVWAWWGPDRVGAITCGRTPNPSTSTATVFLSANNGLIDPTKGGKYQDDPVSIRVGEVRVYYRPYQTVMTEDNIATSVSVTTRVDFKQPYRVARAFDSDATADADFIEIFTSIDLYADALRLAQYVLAILKTDRRLLTVTLDGGILAYFIGTIMNVVLNRYDQTPGKNYCVVRLAESYGDSGSSDRVEVALLG